MFKECFFIISAIENVYISIICRKQFHIVVFINLNNVRVFIEYVFHTTNITHFTTKKRFFR